MVREVTRKPHKEANDISLNPTGSRNVFGATNFVHFRFYERTGSEMIDLGISFASGCKALVLIEGGVD
jgi:hypothetical protein